MSKLTDHALFDIVLTHDEVYKLRLCVDRYLESLSKIRETAIRYDLSHGVEDHLISRYLKIKAKLSHVEKFLLYRGHFHLRFIQVRED